MSQSNKKGDPLTQQAGKTRVSIWLNTEDLLAFNRLYPMHGAFTNFVRKSLEARLKRVTKEVEELTDE